MKRKIKVAELDYVLEKNKRLHYDTDYLVIDEPLKNIRDFHDAQKMVAHMIEQGRYHNFQIMPAVIFRRVQKGKTRCVVCGKEF